MTRAVPLFGYGLFEDPPGRYLEPSMMGRHQCRRMTQGLNISRSCSFYNFLLSVVVVLLLRASSSPSSSTAAAAFTLITFDVDGTLVRGSGKAADASAHARAFAIGTGKVFNSNRQPTPPVADVLPRHLFHGSTDGLITLRLARAACQVPPKVAHSKLDQVMDAMYEYIASLEDHEVAEGITVLPGVLDHLETLAGMKEESGGNGGVACGLVTGNVEGIARRKMRAVGVLATNALAPPSLEQVQSQSRWKGSEELGFLGGFGSDYCSGDIDDLSRNHLDRAEQIAIATRRCQSLLISNHNNNDNNKKLEEENDDRTASKQQQTKRLTRVVHVGDAPADVLAAKSFAFQQKQDGALLDNSEKNGGLCVGMVGVATGSYGADELRELAGEPVPGLWEPVILEEGMADPNFLQACGVL